MLLNEVIQTDKIVKIKKTFDVEKLGKPIGKGSFAAVYKGKKPGTVIKVAKTEEQTNDPYVSFIREALNHQDNPFFPKIYNAKLYEHSGQRNKGLFVVEMEELLPLDTRKIREAQQALLRRLGLDPDIGLFGQFRNKYRRNKLKLIAEEQGEEKFAEALEAAEPLFNKYKPDLHEANLMIRLTSVGPQLVFTDPVF